jgi:uncharacterized protein YndB with AHSA1/START domain
MMRGPGAASAAGSTPSRWSGVRAARSPRAREVVLGATLRALVLAAPLAALWVPGATAADEVVASRRVAASPAQVWQVLTDFPHWTSIFPNLAESTLDASVHPPRMHQVTRILGFRIEHTSVVQVEPEAHRLVFRLDPTAPHDVDALDSVWAVEPSGDGGSLIELRLHIEASQHVPDFIRHRIFEHSVSSWLAALADAVGRRATPELAGVP